MSGVVEGVGALAIRDVDGEPRIRDVDLAERLGFAKPNNIRKLIGRHKLALSALGTCSTVEQVKRGQRTEEHYLNRRQAIFITAKSGTPTATEITVEIVRRFDEYELGERPAAVLPSLDDPRALRALLLSYADRQIELQERVNELKPKAAALDRLADRRGSTNISDTAKVLNVRPGELFAFLSEHRWIFRRDEYGPWRGFQSRIDAGLLIHVETRDQRRPDRTFTVCNVTPRGRATLAEMLERKTYAPFRAPGEATPAGRVGRP